MYLDECGFAPSQPVSYSWVRAGERKRIPYENPEGRRENVLAVLEIDGPVPALHWVGYAGTWRGVHLARAFEELLDQPATDGRPLVIVLDNASSHHSHALRDALPPLVARGLTLYYLPPASPELNAVEHVFRAIKHTHLPERRYTSQAALHAAVDAAFAQYEAILIAKSAPQLGLAARSCSPPTLLRWARPAVQPGLRPSHRSDCEASRPRPRRAWARRGPCDGAPADGGRPPPCKACASPRRCPCPARSGSARRS